MTPEERFMHQKYTEEMYLRKARERVIDRLTAGVAPSDVAEDLALTVVELREERAILKLDLDAARREIDRLTKQLEGGIL